MRIGSTHALFIDFDGTLIDLAPRPSEIQVPDGLADLLVRLHRALSGALAVVTGRPIAQIDQYLALPAGVAVAGVHGAQLRVDGELMSMPALDDALAEIRPAVDRLAERHPALLIEPKPVALAVHFRADPSLGAMVYDELERLVAPRPGLKLMRGHAVCEVKPVWASKGAAIERLLMLPAFAGRTPVMIGDDVTDEDGFRVVLAAGGEAIKVGEGKSLATHRMHDPGAVRHWLADTLAWLESAGQ
ncbi:MAG: trehalose-phosphatase [Burkholderiaceae bacterium]